MSRNDVLVDADWVQAHLDDPKVVLVEVDEDTSAYDKNHIRNAVRIDWKRDLQDPVRRDFVNQEQFEALLSERGIANDDTVVLYGGNNNWFASYAYWYFKLYGHERRQAARRRPQEVGAGLPRAGRRAVPTRAATSYTAQPQDRLDPRLPRRRRGRDRHRRTWSTCARPDEFSGKLLAPAHLPQEQSQRPGHVPTAREHPVVQGGQRRRHVQVRRGADRAVRGRGRGPVQGHHRLLPHRRALGAHLVRAARAARPGRT